MNMNIPMEFEINKFVFDQGVNHPIGIDFGKLYIKDFKKITTEDKNYNQHIGKYGLICPSCKKYTIIIDLDDPYYNSLCQCFCYALFKII